MTHLKNILAEEYIIYGTLYKNLKSILTSKYIEANVNKKNEGMLNKSDGVNQIFTQLLYRDIPNQNGQISFWFDCCFVLDKQILMDYPFYATGIGEFNAKFSDALKKRVRVYLYKK